MQTKGKVEKLINLKEACVPSVDLNSIKTGGKHISKQHYHQNTKPASVTK